MAYMDREVLRGLVLTVVKQMVWDEHWSRKKQAQSQVVEPVAKDDTTPGIRLTENEEAILDIVMEAGGASTGHIAGELGLRSKQVSKRCQNMRLKGLLEVVGHVAGEGLNTRQSVWRATPCGLRSAITPNPGVWVSRPRKEASA